MSGGERSLSEKVDAAFRATATTVIERDKQTGTPVIVWEDGHINVPQTIPSQGLIVDAPDFKTTVGIWLMPDNEKPHPSRLAFHFPEHLRRIAGLEFVQIGDDIRRGIEPGVRNLRQVAVVEFAVAHHEPPDHHSENQCHHP